MSFTQKLQIMIKQIKLKKAAYFEKVNNEMIKSNTYRYSSNTH